jgi:hypothetical protein
LYYLLTLLEIGFDSRLLSDKTSEASHCLGIVDTVEYGLALWTSESQAKHFLCPLVPPKMDLNFLLWLQAERSQKLEQSENPVNEDSVHSAPNVEAGATVVQGMKVQSPSSPKDTEPQTGPLQPGPAVLTTVSV